MSAPPRLSLVTLGVTDVAASTAFYQRLGWPLSPASVPGEVSFFRTAGGILALYGFTALAADAGLSGSVTTGFRGVALAINCDDREQVDETLRIAGGAGAASVKAAQPADWGGYSGYFADPDRHLWEVAHNPAWTIGEDGCPVLP
jgi:predicted lactoylglutathione lyase